MYRTGEAGSDWFCFVKVLKDTVVRDLVGGEFKGRKVEETLEM